MKIPNKRIESAREHMKATLVGLNLLGICGVGLAIWGMSSFSYVRLLAGGGLVSIVIFAKWSVNRRRTSNTDEADRA